MHITYMGTKRRLSSVISEIICTYSRGSVLDAFAGVGSIAASLRDERPVWCNDAQAFSNLVTRSLYTSGSSPDLTSRAWNRWEQLFQKHFDCLVDTYASQIDLEQAYISRNDIGALRECADSQNDLIRRQKLDQAFRKRRVAVPPAYDLFVQAYRFTYFSAIQSIEIDSARYAIDALLGEGVITDEAYNWCLLALCLAVSHCAFTTGHFAQFLSVKESNLAFFKKKRARSIKASFEKSIAEAEPVGSLAWRRGNGESRLDATDIASSPAVRDRPPDLIYADPPYTKDQYSRFYHLYETLIEYDYPVLNGKAAYRAGRFHSRFSKKSQVHSALDQLIHQAYLLGSSLLISYPCKGLVADPRSEVRDIGRKYFRDFRLEAIIPHSHSTLGGSTGASSRSVDELLFYGSVPL